VVKSYTFNYLNGKSSLTRVIAIQFANDACAKEASRTYTPADSEISEIWCEDRRVDCVVLASFEGQVSDKFGRRASTSPI
jgi:hypothetical protein